MFGVTRSVCWVLALSLLAACGDGGGGEAGDTGAVADVEETADADADVVEDTATPVDTAGPARCLTLSAEPVSLGRLDGNNLPAGGGSLSREVTLTNTCDDAVSLTELRLVDDNDAGDCAGCGFSLDLSAIPGVPAGGLAPSDPALSLASGAAVTLTLTFFADETYPGVLGALTLEATLHLAGEPDGAWTVPVTVRTGDPEGCVVFDADSHDFGEVVVGTTAQATVRVTNACDEPVAFTYAGFGESSAALGFSADLSSLLGHAASALHGSDPPAEVAGGASWDLVLLYTPTEPADFAKRGTFELHWGWPGTATGQFKNLEVQGVPVDDACPHPRITVAEGEAVDPGTELHLSGSASIATTGGPITAWTWSVTAPIGSSATFQPDASGESVTFTPDVPGGYGFSLQVTDESGKAGCEPDVAFVQVGEPLEINVLVTWTPEGTFWLQPGLHFAHPNASGRDLWGDATPEPWYDQLWDCYPGNCDLFGLDWGVPDDYTDNVWILSGDKKSELEFPRAEAGLTYRVGVDSPLSDMGGGTPMETRTARIEISLSTGASLVLEDQALVPGDFWDVAIIDTAAGTITKVDQLHHDVNTHQVPE
ncbi:MAG: hypothetical protein EP329_27845 [Deltaproteobacteria bacterium]|nr:MAG: hypothetical protein EP329_27845 [Deltaproteobacteria bacterium]